MICALWPGENTTSSNILGYFPTITIQLTCRWKPSTLTSMSAEPARPLDRRAATCLAFIFGHSSAYRIVFGIVSITKLVDPTKATLSTLTGPQILLLSLLFLLLLRKLCTLAVNRFRRDKYLQKFCILALYQVSQSITTYSSLVARFMLRFLLFSTPHTSSSSDTVMLRASRHCET